MSDRPNVGRTDSRRGAILVLFSLAAVPVFAVLGLVLDGGRLYFERRQAQAAADAAAWGGAKELIRLNDGLVVEAGRADARRMGFDDADPSVVVTINHPPLNGIRAGDPKYVEAIVEREAPATLLRMTGRDRSTVRARAVAGIEVDFSGPCLLALNPTANGAIRVNGTAELNAPGCEVIARSNSASAILANGGGCITAAVIGYPAAGGFQANGQNCLNGLVGPVIPPPDPYANLAEPNTAGDPNRGSYPVRATNRTQISNGDVVLSPGIYQRGIKITGGNVVLSPGTYIVDGLEVSGGATLSGEGVTIFNTASGGLRNISIAGSVVSRLRAPLTGYYANILFFNARVNVSGPSVPYEMTIDGGAGSYWDGIIYAPTVHVDFVGNTLSEVGGRDVVSQVVANTVRFTGRAEVHLAWPGSGRTPTATRVSMVE